jgi:hypothetical protein
LWWTKWRWARFSPSTSVSPANLHSTKFSILTITRSRYNRTEVADVPSGPSLDSTVPPPPTYANLNTFFLTEHGDKVHVHAQLLDITLNNAIPTHITEQAQSRLVFGMCLVRISDRRQAILIEDSRVFSQTLKVNAEVVPRLHHGRFLPKPLHFFIFII